MSGNRKPKFNYKIFNKKTGKYVSSRGKGTWVSRSWVTYHIPKHNVNDFEIHIFPISSAIVVPAQEFLSSLEEEQAAEEKIRQEKKKSLEEKKRKERLKQQYEEDLQRLKEIQSRIERYQNL